MPKSMRDLALITVLLVVASAASAGPAATDRTHRQWMNGRLAFIEVLRGAPDEGSSRLVVSDPTGGRRTVISIPAEALEQPAWSPGGTSIALSETSSTSSTFGIYVVNPDGSGLRRLATGSAPTWSPDGTKLAFARGGQVHVIDADGTNERALTSGFEPAWSPDGAKIAFTRGQYFRGDLFTIGVDGSGLTQLTTGSRDRNPEWSPNGSRIVFDRLPSPRDVASIYVVKRNGTGIRRLTRTLGTRPVWSPDGSKILFGGRGEILVMNPDGSDLTNLTRTPRRLETDPALQPVLMRNGAFSGTRFDDYLAGGSGSEVIRGYAGDDVIIGGPGRDLLDGGEGNDTFRARDGRRDVVLGGPGSDRAFIDRRLDRVRRVESVSYARG